MSSAIEADRSLDVTAEVCPMTYVRTRLALDRMAAGQVLAVHLRGDDAARNVPLSAERQGHKVLSQQVQPDGSLWLLLRKS